MPKAESHSLSRRETQIMEILHELGRATAAEVQQRLPDPPGYSSVRKQLELLEGKQLIRHEIEGRQYVYSPVASREAARRSALQRMLRTFFDGSSEQAAAALLSMSDRKVDRAALERILEEAERARRKGR